MVLTGLRPAASAAERVGLAWDANSEADVAGYRLHYGAPPGNYAELIDCGNVTNIVVTNLHAGRVYGFRVTCYNKLGLESDPSTPVTATAAGIDHPPIADSRSLTVAEGEVIAFQLTGSDPEGDPLTYPTVSVPLRGTLDGTASNFVYRAFIGDPGSDEVRFQVHDGYQLSDPGIIRITVEAVTNATRIDLFSVLEDTPQDFEIPAVDELGRPLNYRVITAPTHGDLAGTAPRLTYHPESDYSGNDDFVLRADSADSGPHTILARVSIRPVDDPPRAEPQDITVENNTTAAIWLFAYDSDTPGPLTYSIVTLPSHGLLTFNQAEAWYTPEAGYVGEDQFRFAASAGMLDSEAATVTLHVLPAYLPPAVDAGPDRYVVLPARAMLWGTVKGNNSSRLGNLVETLWTQCDGPATAEIANPTAAVTWATLPVAGNYCFELRASDGRSEIRDSLLISASAPPERPTNSAPFVRFLEVDAGRITPPMKQSQDVDLSGFTRSWVATGETNAGTIAWEFEVPASGSYVVWCRVLTPDPGRQSWFVLKDTPPNAEQAADFGDPEFFDNQWHWARLAGRNGDNLPDNFAYSLNPLVYSLNPGAHQLTFRGRDPDTRLEAVVITDDFLFDPTAADHATNSPVVSVSTGVSGALQMTWPAVPGRRYVIQATEDLHGGNWLPVSPMLRATTATLDWPLPDAGQSAAQQRFYAVVSLP